MEGGDDIGGEDVDSVGGSRQGKKGGIGLERDWRFAIETFVTDTVVTILIPKEDRGTLDHPRLYARVVDQPHPGRYQLQTEHGILDRLYPTGVLNRVPNPELVGMSLLFSYTYIYLYLYLF